MTTDMIPKETATEMLLTEKRLSNTMRKRCVLARSTITNSEAKPRTAEDRLTRKVRGCRMTQLVAWLRRATDRRLVVQRAWLKAHANYAMPASIRASVCALYEEKAKNLELLADTCRLEIKRRVA